MVVARRVSPSMSGFVWRILVAEFGGEICMADLYSGFV